MKSLVISLLTAAAFFLSPVVQASAVTPDQPHDFTCATCHSPHKTLGSTGYDNICLNCHRGGDPRAGAKSFAPGDAADPFNRYTSGISNRIQISHRWDGSDTNPRAGAAAPVQPQMTSVRGRTSSSMACVRCHNPHSEVNKPFLRMANDSDQMCLDCHRSRNTADQTKGTHPVGVDYLQKASANASAFNPSPVNANPSNPTSAMKLPGGKVSCSSCHGVHATDSNSSTFDSFTSLSNLKPSDGNLLRTDRRAATADGINICTNCHAGKVAHNGRGQNIQCGDCHGAHVDLGDGSVPNVWLVKREMGAGRGQVVFNSSTVKNYMSADGSGVCQSCHAVPTGSGYPAEHNVGSNSICNDCHIHGNSLGSYSVDPTKACNACHGYPPLINSAGAGGYAAGYQAAPSFADESLSGHASHASTPYQKACINCHNGYSHRAGTFQDVFINTPGTVAATGGLSPVYDKAAQTCSNVYCHSNANPRGGINITKTTPSWNGGKGKIIGTAGECAICHSAAGDSLPSWSAPHTKHINGYAANQNFTCTTCHAGTASGNSAIFDNITARSMHTNGVKDVVFNSFAHGGLWDQNSATCSNLYCHSNVQGSAGVGAPTGFSSGLNWNATTMNCGSCHASMNTFASISTATGSHKRHVQGYSYACSACHGAGYSATGNVTPASSHVDGIITMGFTGTAATNGATPNYYQGNHKPGDGYKNCSNIYCHSNVQGSGGSGAPTTFAAPVWGAAALPCGSCHANMATSAAATGSHIKHVQLSGYSCPICHNGAGKDPNPPFSATAKHADGTIEISFSGSAVGAAYSKGGSVSPGTGYGSCSNASCHADPYSPAMVTTPVWGAVSASGCTACHSGAGTFSGTGNGPATGSHNKHMAASVPVVCGDCHAGAVSGSSGGTAHGDGNIDVTNSYPANVAKHVIGTPYTGTCSTTCHSATTAAVITPVWGAAATCSSCHDSAPATGGHSLHFGFTVSAVCADCHAGAVVDANAGTAHLNGTINVTGGYPASVAKHAAETGYSTCSAASCHANPYGTGSVTTPVWGPGSGNHCAACHNGIGAFDAVLGSPATGTHAKHMALSGALCNQCHAGAIKNIDGGSLHKNGNVDVTNSYPANVAKHAAGTYTGTCSTYCHGSSMPNGDITGTKRSPRWNDPSYLTPSISAAACGTCHGFPPSTASGHPGGIAMPAGFPATASIGTTCSCHSNVNTAGNSYATIFVNPALHVNGVLEPAATGHTFPYGGSLHLSAAGVTPWTSCTGCHTNTAGGTYPVASGTAPNCTACHISGIKVPSGTSSCWDCHGASATDGKPNGNVFPNISGNHTVHAAIAGTTCATCHAGGGSGTVAHGSGNRVAATTASVKVAFTGQGAAPLWTLASKTCSATNCHGQGTPVWGARAGAPVNGFPHSSVQCDKCHSGTSAAPFYSTAIPKVTANTNAKVGAHTSHLTTPDGLAAVLACSDCHGTVALNTATHMNGAANFTWSTLATKGGVLAPTYTAATRVCSNVYCHGASMSGGDTTGTNRTPVWNVAFLSATLSRAACASCHGFPPPTTAGHPSVTVPASWPAAGAATGALGTTCSCHANISSTGTTYANIFVNKAEHIDGTLQVSGGHAIPFYAHSTPPFTSCTGCHNASAAGPYPAASAGAAPNCRGCHAAVDPTVTATGCTSCHANPPSGAARPNVAGSHAKHIALVGTPNNCAICHNGAGSGSGAAHGPGNNGTNPAVDNIIFTAAQAGASATWASGTKTCSTTYCHGATLAGGTAKNPVWGTTLTGCGLCHGDPPATTTHTGVTVTQCINCHAHVNAAGTGFTNAVLHINGTVEASGSCISCHASAQTGTHGTPRDAITTEFGLAWGHKKTGRGAVTDADCIVCHLEGEFATQAQSAKHADGNIDLRDPDGVGEAAITNITGGAFSFTKFAISFAAGSRTSTGHTSNTDIANVITQKFCLACHDSNGATNTTARSNNGGIGTAMMPFGGINLGATYTLLNGAAAVGGVVDAKTQFATANSSGHPVTGPRSKSYPTPAKLVAPYNNFTRTGGTKSNSVVMNCFDCHNETLTIASRITNRTIVAHGNALTIPGTLYAAAVGGNSVASPTFCINCHIGGYNTTAGGHGTGSAISSTASNGDMTAARFTNCASCHFSNGFKPARPLQAADVHGFNGLAATGGAWTVGNGSGMRPVALMRNVARWGAASSPRPSTAPGLTGTGATCQTSSGSLSSTGGVACGNSMGTYTPGGAY